MPSKKIETWEREKGVIIRGADPSEVLSADEFAERSRDAIGIDFEAREQFLRDNGYDVTRENLLDPTLSTVSN